MIAVTLQNDLKCLYLFLLWQNSAIRFQNKYFYLKLKAQFFRICLASKLNNANWVKKLRLEFDTKPKKKCVLTSEPKDLMKIIDSKNVRLEFKNFHYCFLISRWCTFWLKQHRWGLNSILTFLADMHPIIYQD